MVIDPFARGIPAAAAKLAADEQGSTDAATAIMTTDTHKKEYAIQFELGGKTCTVGAIGKGSGMIAPNMATMLAFYTTDAAVSPILLEKALKTVVPGTYNQMSVDLDTSTNDTLIIMASGLAGNPEICAQIKFLLSACRSRLGGIVHQLFSLQDGLRFRHKAVSIRLTKLLRRFSIP